MPTKNSSFCFAACLLTALGSSSSRADDTKPSATDFIINYVDRHDNAARNDGASRQNKTAQKYTVYSRIFSCHLSIDAKDGNVSVNGDRSSLTVFSKNERVHFRHLGSFLALQHFKGSQSTAYVVSGDNVRTYRCTPKDCRDTSALYTTAFKDNLRNNAHMIDGENMQACLKGVSQDQRFARVLVPSKILFSNKILAKKSLRQPASVFIRQNRISLLSLS